jgi:hypothetical protein
MGITRPTNPTIKRLFAKSGNRCAFPKCTHQIVQDDGTVIGRVCHIKGRSRQGPRYDDSQTPDQRHGFDNLVLMCGNHHTVIDTDEGSYTVKRLQEIKRAHEASAHQLPEAEAAMGAAALSVNQSGGITAQTVTVENAHFYGSAVTPAPSPHDQTLALLGPELARILANQIRALDRAVVSFSCASAGHPAPGDHWTTFRPRKPTLYPGAAQVRDLDADDCALLAEFYNGLQEVEEVIDAWRAADETWTTNHWNVLMQKIERSVASGLAAAARFCPGRQYDATLPASGTLVDRAAASRRSMRQTLDAHIARYQALGRATAPKPAPRRG